jgi:hypothetical protein
MFTMPARLRAPFHRVACASRARVAITTVRCTRFCTQAASDDEQLQAFAELMQQGIGAGAQVQEMQSQMTSALAQRGWFACDGFLGTETCATLRSEVERLRASGHFDQSYSEVAETGEKIWRENVDAMELGSQTWREAPTLVALVAEMMQELPAAINAAAPDSFDVPLHLSSETFGHKLACSSGEGAFYPKHLDNTLGPPMDTRKLTAIYYINPGWDEANGGAIRLYDRLEGAADAPATSDAQDVEEIRTYSELAPLGDRLLMFWSDLIVHEVLPSWEQHRYTFTFWFSSDNPICIANINDRHFALREAHYPKAS